jgi:oxalate decarboxylase
LASQRQLLIGLNSGTYQAVDLSQWIAGNPADVLATNFAQRPELFADFPHHDVFLAGKDGPSK